MRSYCGKRIPLLVAEISKELEISGLLVFIPTDCAFIVLKQRRKNAKARYIGKNGQIDHPDSE